ncbi:hypothetical protein D1159_01995 [Pseudoflavonifractor sp. 524-17]|uniref:hypothetical protein n=1 Tax=Pseudoflavonifractor sp. 524-17 TaxID=2304577 RepID=UPI00137B4AA8|nr:hypothetical protein [Pseudoflavonifractor sp. 524-17]NCE63379.1 hypothetical protein [Pseudoflavonifractor sp. 524-17]
MAELEEKLNAIFSDPEAMGQIVSIAQALTGEAPVPQQAPPPADGGYEPVQPPEEAPSSPGGTDWNSLLGLLGTLSGGGDNPLSVLGELDPALVQKALRLLSEYNAADSQKTALLNALKPFVKEERYANVDKAVKIAKLSRVIRVAFALFKKEGGDGHV